MQMVTWRVKRNRKCEDRGKHVSRGTGNMHVAYGTELGSMSFGVQGLGYNP